MVSTSFIRVLFTGIPWVGVVVVQGLSAMAACAQRIDACTSPEFYFYRVPAGPLSPGGTLTLLWFQEIQEAKNELRAKGVTVD